MNKQSTTILLNKNLKHSKDRKRYTPIKEKNAVKTLLEKSTAQERTETINKINYFRCTD